MKTDDKPATWYGATKAYALAVQCPRCLAAPHQPCLNYKGTPKQSCPERMDLVRPRKRRRRAGKPWTQGELFPDQKGGAS